MHWIPITVEILLFLVFTRDFLFCATVFNTLACAAMLDIDTDNDSDMFRIGTHS